MFDGEPLFNYRGVGIGICGAVGLGLAMIAGGTTSVAALREKGHLCKAGVSVADWPS